MNINLCLWHMCDFKSRGFSNAANGQFRRNLVIAGRSGEGPFTILFADLRYRALPTGCLLSSRSTPWQAASIQSERKSGSH
jgi:hypothetical protein